MQSIIEVYKLAWEVAMIHGRGKKSVSKLYEVCFYFTKTIFLQCLKITADTCLTPLLIFDILNDHLYFSNFKVIFQNALVT